MRGVLEAVFSDALGGADCFLEPAGERSRNRQRIAVDGYSIQKPTFSGG